MPGNKNSGRPDKHLGNPGNKGGGRLGYTYEKDQLKKLRQIIDRALFKMEAIEKGRVTEKEVEKFKIMLPVILKAMDKLHPNKQQVDNNVNVNLTISQVLDEIDDGRTIEGQKVEDVPLIQNQGQE